MLKPSLYDLRILHTEPKSLTISARLNFTNPTPYSATIPYLDVQIVKNGSVLAHATVRDVEVSAGKNEGMEVRGVYDPVGMNGDEEWTGLGLETSKSGEEGKGAEAAAVGREFLSQYLSGFNTSFTLRTHSGSLPSLPKLGKALSQFEVEVPTPRLGGGGGKGEGKPHFIKGATMHLLTSTATFRLLSPLRHETLYLTSINATAYYEDEPEPVGTILYQLPFAIPPRREGEEEGTETPRLPVDWSLGSVGYGAVKRALGGKLELGAYAEVGVRVGMWEEQVWFRGEGIGTRIGL